MTGWIARPSVHLAVAFLAMGGWAVFANRHHPMPEPLIAGGVQGLLSVGITRVLQAVIEAATLRLSGWQARVVPPLAAFGVSAGCLTVVHRLAGTPELLATIALPLVVSTGYSVAYTQACLGRMTHGPA